MRLSRNDKILIGVALIISVAGAGILVYYYSGIPIIPPPNGNGLPPPNGGTWMVLEGYYSTNAAPDQSGQMCYCIVAFNIQDIYYFTENGNPMYYTGQHPSWGDYTPIPNRQEEVRVYGWVNPSAYPSEYWIEVDNVEPR